MRQPLGIFVLGSMLAMSAAARAADYSAPRKTVETFAQAVEAENADAVKDCIASDDPEQQAALDMVAKVIVATSHLRHAAIAKFGDDGKAIMGAMHRRPLGDNIREAMERSADAEEKISGSMATLTLPSDPNASKDAPQPRPLYFKKVGGDWKVDWDKQTAAARSNASRKPPGGNIVERMTPLMVKAMRDTADDINGSKYATIDEAKVGLQQRMAEAFRSMIPQRPGASGGQ